MLSKNKIKYIKGLSNKKTRQEENTFVAEGPKTVSDLMTGMKARTLIATHEWLDMHCSLNAVDIIEVTDEELRKASLMQHPQDVIALFDIPRYDINTDVITDKLCLALDGVQDPGNLGTIIRIADWFGITDIYCSPNTADAWNPKTVQSTMGSLARTHIYYTELAPLIDSLPEETPVYGTMLDGDNIYEAQLADRGLIVMGNEGNGISDEIARRIRKKLLIPSFPPKRETADSLNVAIATAVTVATFRQTRNNLP
jgi:TrmH family RNA methyltransferase